MGSYRIRENLGKRDLGREGEKLGGSRKSPLSRIRAIKYDEMIIRVYIHERVVRGSFPLRFTLNMFLIEILGGLQCLYDEIIRL